MKYSYGSLYDDELKSYLDNITPALKNIIKKSFPYLYSRNSINNKSHYTKNDLLQEAFVFAIEAFYKFNNKPGDNLTSWSLYYVECSFKKLKKEIFQYNSDHISLDGVFFEKKHEDLADDIFNDISTDTNSFIYELNIDDHKSDDTLSEEQVAYLKQIDKKLNNSSVSEYLSLIITNNNSATSDVDISKALKVSKSRISQIKGEILKVASRRGK